ncbi:hypothetical protein Y032_0363g3521 [Ancylostoma ceylanicum]|uniref:SH2 domain-containing protein n=1 Tax=Ancylostoma ceylanicum TaxID=53326 RepID=A0A016RV96_9BILA|nr:hypothetical protein Y032_0363g3521 [Ancylostoma ceylanicum]
MATPKSTSRPKSKPPSESTSIKDPGDSTAQKAVDVWLFRSGFYHGYLPREDVAALLKRKGDFLVRLSEAVSPGCPTAIMRYRAGPGLFLSGTGKAPVNGLNDAGIADRPTTQVEYRAGPGHDNGDH